MPSSQAYADHSYYLGYFKLQDEGTERNAMIDELCRDASRTIDAWCKRQFGQSTVATARRVSGTENKVLYVDDISSDDGLVVQYRFGGTRRWETLASTNYELGPEGAVDSHLEPRPYSFIELYPDTTDLSYWPQSVRVTAKWGWPSVPEPIKACTAELVGNITLESPRAKVEVSAVGVPIELNVDAKKIMAKMLAPYRKVYF